VGVPCRSRRERNERLRALTIAWVAVAGFAAVAGLGRRGSAQRRRPTGALALGWWSVAKWRNWQAAPRQMHRHRADESG
jgi:hypothetical protein